MRITQQKKILKLLRENSQNSHDLTYIHNVKQAPTRISELKEQGYNIISTNNYTRKSPSVDYSLIEAPKPVYKWIFEGNIAKQIQVS